MRVEKRRKDMATAICSPHNRPAPVISKAHQKALDRLHYEFAFLKRVSHRDWDTYGFQPIHQAVYCGNIEVVRSLLKDGGLNHPPSQPTWCRPSPLHIAVTIPGQKGVEMVTLLLDNSAKLNDEDFYDQTPLHNAAISGIPETIKVLLDCGAAPEPWGKDGWTPFHLACISGNEECVCLFLDHPRALVDPNCLTGNGITPLHIACYFRHTNIMAVLLRRGAFVDSGVEFLEYRDLTCLHMASHLGDLEVVRSLIAHGADINALALYSITGRAHSPLHSAIQAKKEDVAELLLEHGAIPDLIPGDNPLISAVRRGNTTLTAMLLKHKANVNGVTLEESRTCLHVAVINEYVGVIKLLIEHGANTNAVDVYNCTPLHLAVRQDNSEIAETLLSHEPDLSIRSNANETPLTNALRNKHETCAGIVNRYCRLPLARVLFLVQSYRARLREAQSMLYQDPVVLRLRNHLSRIVMLPFCLQKLILTRVTAPS